MAGKVLGWDRMPAGPPDQLCFYDQSKAFQMGAYATRRIFTEHMQGQLREHNPAALFTVPEPRPEFLISRDFRPLQPVADDALLPAGTDA